MNFSRPFQCITPTVDGDVLQALALADAWFTVSRLSAVIGHWSNDGVRRSLRRLEEQGIVEAEPAGSAVLYRLNRDHLASDAVVALANLRLRLVEKLRVAVEAWQPQPIYMALFGSVTGTRMIATSDVDVFVVGPETDESRWADQMAELKLTAGRWTGNDVQFLEFTEPELVGPVGEPGSVLHDVLSVGITVMGDRDRVARQARAA